MRNHPEFQEEAAMITVVTLGYGARCTEQGCGNLGRVILRYADGGGRPLSNLERSNAHAREAIERETKAGLTIHDDRDREWSRA